MKRHHITAGILILFNLIPLYGVLYDNWSISGILISYWVENLIIGFFNYTKMQRSNMSTLLDEDTKRQLAGTKNGKRSAKNCRTKEDLIRFFIKNFFGFTVVHGLFLFTILSMMEDIKYANIPTIVILLFFSHGFSYLINFIGNKEYERISTQRLFLQPYSRVIVMHLTVILMGWFIAVPVLIILIKIFIDTLFHIKEHRGFSKQV